MIETIDSATAAVGRRGPIAREDAPGQNLDGYRRSNPDRRRRPTPILSRYTFRGRRRGGRREGERESLYVDRPGRLATVAFILVPALSAVDAFYTLKVVSQGVQEVNPVMRLALSYGAQPFLLAKMILTFFAITFLVLHVTWRRARLCLVLTLICYTLVTAYHLYGQLVLGWQ